MPNNILDEDAELLTDETYTKARQFVETVQGHAYGDVDDETLLEEYSSALSLMHQMEQTRTSPNTEFSTEYDRTHAAASDDRMEATGDKYEDIREAVSLGTEYIMNEFDQSQVAEITDSEAASLLEP